MSAERTLIEQTLTTLKQQRDELALQIHLGSMEAKEEYDRAKEKLDQMTHDYEPVKDAVEESASNVFSALQLVGEEVMSSFDRVRKSLQ